MRFFANAEHDIDESFPLPLPFTPSPDPGIWWTRSSGSEACESLSELLRWTSDDLSPPATSPDPAEPSLYPDTMLPPPLSPPPLFRSSTPLATPSVPTSPEPHPDLVMLSVQPTIPESLACMESHQHVPAERVWYAPRSYWDAIFKEEQARDQRRSSRQRRKAISRVAQIPLPRLNLNQILTRSTRRRSQKLVNLDGPVEILVSRTRSGRL